MVNLAPFLAYVVVTTFTPGPNNILSMSNAVRCGYRGTLRFLAGVAAGFFIVMSLCGLLNVTLVSLLPAIRPWLNVLGAAYMVYLAVHIVFSKPSNDDSPSAGNLNTFWAGFTLQFMNLKGILYGITVFSIFITPAFKDPLIVGLFVPLLTLICFLAVSAWALGGNLFRQFLHKNERWFNLVMGALLVYIAIASLLSSHT
jgi:cysteine/O-acetylserine efflux protein